MVVLVTCKNEEMQAIEWSQDYTWIIRRLSRYLYLQKSYRKTMNRNWGNQKANPALKTKTENK